MNNSRPNSKHTSYIQGNIGSMLSIHLILIKYHELLSYCFSDVEIDMQIGLVICLRSYHSVLAELKIKNK